MANLTLLDIAKLNGNDKVTGLIEESIRVSPEAQVIPAKQIAGTNFYTMKRTALPTVGFTAANAGIAASKSTFVRSLHECYILRGAIECDAAVGMAYEGGMNALEMIEAQGVMESALRYIGGQVWEGTTNDATGFPGLKAFTPHGGSFTYNALGNTASVNSSVYMVKFGAQGISMVFGNNSTLSLGDFRDQQLTDGSGYKYAGRVSELTAWVGLQIPTTNCCVRINNLTVLVPLTDAILNAALALFPANYVPDAIFMSRRSRNQLQSSRTVTITTGGNTRIGSAPQLVSGIPTDFQGIPIYVTDSIPNTDATNA